MGSQDTSDVLELLSGEPVFSIPATPEPAHNTLPDDVAAAVIVVQSERIEQARSELTPPPSTTQIPPVYKTKTRTPTPSASHISTPPPTIESHGATQPGPISLIPGKTLSSTELQHASKDELIAFISDLQMEAREAKMSAAHHKLQYQMLSQESTAALERMAVEAHLAQSESEVIYSAEQAKVKPSAQISALAVQNGIIPIQKEHYERMCQSLQLLQDSNHALEGECQQQQRIIQRREDEVASLSDKVTLLQGRIRENRKHLHRYRAMQSGSHVDFTPHSAYSTPYRGQSNQSAIQQPQPFAALLQASEMVSQESARANRKGHARNTMSMSSLPTTPRRHQSARSYTTPCQHQAPIQAPATAPMPRTSAINRDMNIYAQQALPVGGQTGPGSEGTVSASDADDYGDSEAETDIVDPEGSVGESQASRAASQMLRTSQQDMQSKREMMQGSGMVGTGNRSLKQSRLFGAISKPGVDRSGAEPAAKRARMGDRPVGLGISGAR